MKFNKFNFSHYFIFPIMMLNFLISIFLTNLIKKRNKSILLLGHKLTGNVEVIFKEFEADFNLSYMTLNLKDYLKLKNIYGNKILFSLNFFHVYKAFRSKIIISSHGIFFHNLLQKKFTKTIYCGHSIFGSIPQNKDKIIKFFKLYDEVWLHSTYEKKIFINELGCEKDNLKIIGYPRNKVLLDSKSTKETLKSKNLMSGKKIILYAPTANRGNENYINSEFSILNRDFYEFIGQELGPNTILIIKNHLNDNIPSEIKNMIIGNSNIYFSNDLQLKYDYDSLIMSDLLITDFSTIYVDYLLLEKPIYFLDNPDPDPERELSSIFKNKNLPRINNKEEFKNLFFEVESGMISNNVPKKLKKEVYEEFDHSKIIDNIEEIFKDALR